MKFYLALVFLLLLSLCSCELHQQQQKKTNLAKDRNCIYDFPPGLIKMARGIDLNTLNFYPMGNDVTPKQNDWIESIFSFSCKENKTWKAVTLNNTIFSLPDAVQNMYTLPTGLLDSSVEMFSSMEATKNFLDAQAGVGADFAGIGFSASGGYIQVKEAKLKSNKTIALTKAYQSAYEIELKDNIFFSERFSTAVKKLPATYEKDPSAYEKLLERFGTHYFSVARFGGIIILKTEFDSSYVETELSATLKAKLQASFLSTFSADADVDSKVKTIDSQFENHSLSSLHYFGGHSDVALNSRVSDWLETVALDPWLFSGKLVSIDKAIMKQKEMANKAEEVRKAIFIKLAKLALADLENLMSLSEDIKRKVESSKESLGLLTQVRDYFRKGKKVFESSELKENIEKLKKVLKNSNL